MPTTADSSRSRATRAVTEAVPDIVVMPSGKAYLLLRAGPERNERALAWDVLYLAGPDARDLAAPGPHEWLSAVAREFLAAFGPIAEIAKVERFSVTAMFGKAGAEGFVERLSFTRDRTGWHAAPDEGERAVTRVPPVRMELVRDPEEEVSARFAAEEFISAADRADYDAAWARTSALAKARIRRADFERSLEQIPECDRDRDGGVYLSFTAAQEPFLPGANMVAWIGRSTVAGLSVEVLILRLDDDMEWRVADFAWTAAGEPSGRTHRVERAEAF